MSSARFTASLVGTVPEVLLDPDPVIQESTASVSLTAKGVSARPTRHYVWVYDLSGTRVDVIA